MLKILEFLLFCVFVGTNAAVLSCVMLAGMANKKLGRASTGSRSTDWIDDDLS